MYRVYTTCIDHSPYVRLYVSGMYTILITHHMCVYMCIECTLHVLITHHMCVFMWVECTVHAYCVLLLLQHMGEIFLRWTSSNRRDWKERFSFLSEKHFRYYDCRTQLTLISSHGTLGLPVQQNLNSRSVFLTLSRCQNLQFYLIWLLFACSFIPLLT